MASLESIWNSLLEGDPGPSLSLVDSLLDNDLSFAAGGLLRDLAERMVQADSEIDDDQQRVEFVDAINQVLAHAYRDDEASLKELLDEVA